MELAYNPEQPRNPQGEWTRDPGSYVHGMGAGLKVYRGVHGDRAQDAADATRAGAIGRGTFGDSVYTASSPASAVTHAQAHMGDKTGIVIRGTVSPSARIADNPRIPGRYRGTPADWARENGFDVIKHSGIVQVVNPDAVAWDPSNFTAVQASEWTPQGYVIEMALNPDEPGGRGGRYVKATLSYVRQASAGYQDVERELRGPFYHGTRARLYEGDEIKKGHRTDSWGDEGGRSRFVHFTTDLETAAQYARELGPRGRVYEVEPTGAVRPGYGSARYRSVHPLRVMREVGKREWRG